MINYYIGIKNLIFFLLNLLFILNQLFGNK